MIGIFKGITAEAHPKAVYGYYSYNYASKKHTITQYEPISQVDEAFVVDVDSIGECTGLCDFDGRALYVTDDVRDQDGNKYKISKETNMGQYILADKWGMKLAPLTANYVLILKLRKVG